MEGDTPATPTADAVTEAPAPQDQPVETTAPEAVTQESQTEDATNPPEGEESFSNFNLAEVPEEYREHVEKAYKQLQGDHTRKTQEIAEIRKNAESALQLAEAIQTPEGLIGAMSDEYAQAAFSQLAEKLGYQLEGGDEAADGPDQITDELGDDVPEWARAIYQQNRELQEWKDAREAQEQQQAEQTRQTQAEQAFDASIDQQFEELNESLPEPLSQEYSDAVLSHALAGFPPDENGNPQIRKAFDALEAEWKQRETKWAASKNAPHVPSGGSDASQVQDLDDHNERVRWMTERLSGGPVT